MTQGGTDLGMAAWMVTRDNDRSGKTILPGWAAYQNGWLPSQIETGPCPIRKDGGEMVLGPLPIVHDLKADGRRRRG